MQIFKYIILVISFTFVSITHYAWSQSFYQPKGSFSVDVGIPTSERNYAFNTVLEGLFNGGVGYQYNLYKGLTVGSGVKYSFFTNNRFGLQQSVGKGGLHMPSFYVKLGYEKFTTDRFSYSFSMRGGFTQMISVNDSSKVVLGKAYIENTFFIEPQLELLLTADKNDPNAFSLILGYSIYFSEYRPEFLSRETFSGLNADASEGFTRFFSLGFGYRYYFGLN